MISGALHNSGVETLFGFEEVPGRSGRYARLPSDRNQLLDFSLEHSVPVLPEDTRHSRVRQKEGIPHHQLLVCAEPVVEIAGRVVVVKERHRVRRRVPDHGPEELVPEMLEVAGPHAVFQLVPQAEIEEAGAMLRVVQPPCEEFLVRIEELSNRHDRLRGRQVLRRERACVALSVVEAECVEPEVAHEPLEPFGCVNLDARVVVVDVRRVASVLARVQAPARRVVRAELEVVFRGAFPIVFHYRPVPPRRLLERRPVMSHVRNRRGRAVVEHHVNHRHHPLRRGSRGGLEQKILGRHRVPLSREVAMQVCGRRRRGEPHHIDSRVGDARHLPRQQGVQLLLLGHRFPVEPLENYSGCRVGNELALP
mmetsp:Transcript_25149/g.60007  ORF Transcript_25149/g.60007 Transcript_25149/m.60007 type:complete len:366 (+) Transcript_25149:225-1322(+)